MTNTGCSIRDTFRKSLKWFSKLKRYHNHLNELLLTNVTLQATIAKLGAIFSDSQVDDLHRAFQHFTQKKGLWKYTLNTSLWASMMMTPNKLTMDWLVLIWSRKQWRQSYLRKVPEMICVEQELFQTSCVTQNVFWNDGERAMTFVDVLHLSVAALQKGRQALEHCWWRFVSGKQQQNLITW